ncbi:unnamed protein product [Brassicogethes aeneus]|uniref:Uncharacterized protein n=1 Tax=Brassicogethes aeneus TaxID=1431903 RepID=A0A9P0ARG7_BRAAE|nr:unnamed protein product [Brassicogethes aeneus]
MKHVYALRNITLISRRDKKTHVVISS